MSTFTAAGAALRLGIDVKSINNLVRGLKLKPCEGSSLSTWRFTEDAIAARIIERDKANARKQPPPLTPKRGPVFWAELGR